MTTPPETGSVRRWRTHGGEEFIPNGDWVSAADYDRLGLLHAALKAEFVRVNRQVDHYVEIADELNTKGVALMKENAALKAQLAEYGAYVERQGARYEAIQAGRAAMRANMPCLTTHEPIPLPGAVAWSRACGECWTCKKISEFDATMASR